MLRLFLSLAVVWCQTLMAAADVTFIALHPNPGQHFASFAQVLRSSGLNVDIYASEKALEILNHYGVSATDFHPDGPLIQHLDLSEQKALVARLLELCSCSRHVVTDIGEDFFVLLHEALKERYAGSRWAYYDNPQPYVNSIYSRLANDIAGTGARFLYASANLEETGICRQDGASLGVEGVGIGFFPMEDVELLKDLRRQRQHILHNLPEKIRDKRLFAYVGAANSEYYAKTFPYIIGLVAQSQDRLTDCMILLQQHPRAVQEGDYDGRLVDANRHLPIMRSPLSTMEGAAISEIVLYSDTTFAMRAELAGIPINRIDTTTSSEALIETINAPILQPRSAQELVGYRTCWKENLLHLFQVADKHWHRGCCREKQEK